MKFLKTIGLTIGVVLGSALFIASLYASAIVLIGILIVASATALFRILSVQKPTE